MPAKEKQLKRVRAHTRYKLADGTPVPGVTTVLSVLAKPYLVPWANKLGLEGIDSSRYRDALAAVGTLTHARILAHFQGVEPDMREYSQAEIELSDNAILSFYAWEKQTQPRTQLIEKQLVSELESFGGTLDWVGEIGDKIVLIDYKTSKALYDEHKIQLAAYKHLMGCYFGDWTRPIEARIVRIGRDESEGFEERIYTDLSLEWELFKHCRAIYELKRRMAKA